MRKKTAIAAAVLLCVGIGLFIFGFQRPSATSGFVSPDKRKALIPSSPEQTVAGLLDNLKSQQQSLWSDYLTTSGGELPFLEAEQIFGKLLGRLEYRLGDSKIDGESAQVQVGIDAPDLREVAGGLMWEAAKAAALEKLKGGAPNYAELAQKYLLGQVDLDQLPLTSTETMVYLRKTESGHWKVDLADQRNLGFVDALTGGLVSWIQNIGKLMDQLSWLTGGK